ncbi:MAG: hypothetical protein QGH60_21060 [Phycisphaerae bacterium]|nr:hypothetical protein [Phycisphaerae bacterium]
MEQGNDTMPPSSPSWTWESMGAGFKANACDAGVDEHDAAPIIPCCAELPSRRWLVEAARSFEPDG